MLLPGSMETAWSLDFKLIGTSMLIWDGRMWPWNWSLPRVVITEPKTPQKFQKEHKEEAKADEETAAAEEKQEAPILFVTDVNNILHATFSNVEVYNNQQLYKSNGPYAHKSYISNIFKEALFENRGDLHCEGYDHEEFPHKFMEAPLYELFP